jgi:hypothetical protein
MVGFCASKSRTHDQLAAVVAIEADVIVKTASRSPRYTLRPFRRTFHRTLAGCTLDRYWPITDHAATIGGATDALC